MAVWDVLISTIPHRHEKLCLLLAELNRQWQPGFGALLLRDNYQLAHLDSHTKRQQLAEASQADYICDLDDDDWIAPDYVPAIMDVLMVHRPDYVGFRVAFSQDDRRVRSAVHSLHHTEWTGWHEGDLSAPLLRDVTHLNPMRRELALLADWRGHTDEDWSAAIRKTGRVQTQVMIDRDMYFYRFSPKDSFYTQRVPMPEPLPDLPEYPWLTVL